MRKLYTATVERVTLKLAAAFAFAFVAWAAPSYAQLSVTVDGDTAICVGESSQLSSFVVSDSLFDDFDAGISSLMWATTTGISNTICGTPTAMGNAMHFDGTGTREAQTFDFNSSGLTTISFWMIFGSATGGTGCETPDAGEDVVLEYSLDGGTTWTNITTYSTASPPTTWTQFTETVPAGAQTSSTRFRWRQLANSGVNFDNWALDDVEISGSGEYIYAWTPAASLSDPSIHNPVATPATTTTYQLIVSDSAGSVSDTATITVNAGAVFTLSTTLSPASVCLLEDVQGSVIASPAGTYSYLWSGQGAFSDSASATPTINPNTSGTVNFFVEATSADGCTVFDTASVTVSNNPVPQLVVSGDLTPCGADSTQLSALVAGAGSITDNFDGGVNGSLWGVVTGTSNTDCGSVSGDALHFAHAGQREAQTIGLSIAAGSTVDFWLYLGTGVAPCETADAGENVVLEYSTDGGATWTIINTYLAGAYTSFTQITETLPTGAQSAGTRLRWRQLSNSGVDFDAWAIDDVTIAIPGTGGYDFSWSPSTGLSNANIPDPMAAPTTSTLYTVVAVDTLSGCSDTAFVTVSPAPDFTYTAAMSDTLLCLNETAQATITPTAGSYVYQWSGNAGFDSDTIANPMVTSLVNSVTTLYFTIANTAGCEKMDSISFTTNSVPQAIIGLSADTTLCVGDSSLITLSVAGGQNLGDYAYLWSPAATLNNASLASPMASPATATTYTVTATEPTAGCVTTDSITLVPVSSFAYSAAASDTLVCINEPVDLTITVSPAGSYAYQWSGSANFADDTAATASAQFLFGGTSMVYYNIESANGCGKSDSLIVTVANAVFPSLSLFGDSTVCNGDSVQLEAIVSGTNPAYQDNFDGGLNSLLWANNTGVSSTNCGSVSGDALYFNTTGSREAETIDLNVITGGDITFSIHLGPGTAPCETADLNEDVVLEYSTDGGATWTLINTYTAGSFSVFTQIIETVPVAAQTASTRFRWRQLGNSGIDFDNWAIDDVVLPFSGSSGYAFSWSPGATLNDSTSSNPVATPVANTTYVCSVSDTANVCFDTASFAVTLVPDFTFSTSISDTSVCLLEDVQFNVTPSPAGSYSYNWSNDMGTLNDTSIANPLATMNTSGTISYHLLIGSSLGCEKSATYNVAVSQSVQPVAVISGDTTLCSGTSGQLFVSGTGGCPDFSDDFDSGISATLWANNNGIDNTDCGSVNGNALKMDGAGTRVAETVDLNVTCGGDVSFWLYLGSGVAPCETADLNENVTLEFSVDGGASWSVMNTYIAGSYPNFTQIVEAIPSTAQTAATRFRWQQTQNSGTGFDNWAIDEVLIGLGGGSGATYAYSWMPASLFSDPTAVDPFITTSMDTTVTVLVYDTIGGCADSAAQVVAVVPTFTYNATASDSSVCLNEDVQFQVTTVGPGSFSYLWEPDGLMNDSSIANPTGTMSIPGQVAVHYSMANGLGCEQSDSLIISVSGSPTPVISILGDSSICFGDSTMLVAYNAAAGSSLSDDFDGGISGSMWAVNTGIANTNCGSINGNSLWMNDGTDRQAQTVDVNAVSGGTIDFWLVYGAGLIPCENADAGEEMSLEYSIDGGATWVNINTYSNAGPYDTWTFVSEVIPAAAQTPNTRFRWVQDAFSAVDNDNWSLDEVAVNVIGNTVYNINWSPAIGLSSTTNDSVWAMPPTDTLYTVTVVDSIGGCADTASINVILAPNFTYTLTASSAQVCLGEDVQFNIAASPAGSYNYSWAPPVVLDDTAIANPVGTFTTPGSQAIAVMIDNGLGCEKEDSVVVTVSPNQVPTVNILNDPLVCLGDSVLMDIFVTPSEPCEYTLDMADSFGDGWNGGALTATVNGVIEGTYAAANSASTGAIQVPIGDTLVLSYSSGNFETENTYSLFAPDGSLLLSDGPSPTVGVVYTGVADCPQVFNDLAFDWVPGAEVSDPSIPFPWITPSGDSTFMLVVTDTLGGCSDTATWTVSTVPGFQIALLPEDTGVCLGLDVPIQALLTPQGAFNYTVNWDDPSGLLDVTTGPNVTASVTVPGNHVFTVTADNGVGCVREVEAHVAGSLAPQPELSSPGMLFVCQNDTAEPGIDLIPNQDVTCFLNLTLYDAAANGWDSAQVTIFINSVLYDTVAVPTGMDSLMYQIPFDYGDQVACIYTAGNSEADNSLVLSSVTGQVIYSDGPTPTTGVFYNDFPVCTDAGLYNVIWDPTSGLNDSTTLYPLIPSPTSGTYTVIVVDTVGGCSDTASVTLNVTGPLDATITSASQFCTNDGYIVPTAVDAGGTWVLDGMTISDSVSVDSIGLGAHTLIYDIPGSCGDIDTLDFTLVESPTTPTLAADTVCEGDEYVLQPSGANTTEYYTDAGLTVSVGAAPVSVTVNGDTAFYAVVSNTQGCTSGAAAQAIGTWAAPNPGSISGPGQVETVATENYSVTDNPDWTYTWWVTNGNVVSGLGTANVSILWGTVGAGAVNLIVTNMNNCTSDTIVLQVNVNPVGIDEGSAGGWFSVHPNPFRTNALVQFANPNGATFKLELFDQAGRRVYSAENLRGEQANIARAGLAAGVYHLRLTGDQVYNGQLVIEN